MPNCDFEVRAVLGAEDEPSQPRRTDTGIQCKTFFRYVVEGLLRCGAAQDILHRLQAGFDAFGQVSDGMDPAKYVLHNDG